MPVPFFTHPEIPRPGRVFAGGVFAWVFLRIDRVFLRISSLFVTAPGLYRERHSYTDEITELFFECSLTPPSVYYILHASTAGGVCNPVN